MGIRELLGWQWQGYTTYHHSRFNLLIHIVAVPLFLAGNIGLIAAIFKGAPWAAIVSLAAMVLSIAVQGRGHLAEAVPSVPFTSPANAVSRILLEQWITFPRFVLSGGWLRALRQQAQA